MGRVLHLRRILERDREAWEAAGWVMVGGHESPSVGRCLLMEWTGEGEPLEVEP